VNQSIIVDKEFRSLIPPLQSEEFSALEKSLVEGGCRDPLVIWSGENILLDGHNRLKICKEKNIDFQTTCVELVDRLDAKLWIMTNQLSRRNLTDDQRAMVVAEMAIVEVEISKRERAKAGGIAGGVGRPKVENSLSTTVVDELSVRKDVRKEASKRSGLSERKIRNAAKLLKDQPEKAEQVKAGTTSLADAIRETKREEVIATLENIEVKEAKKIEGVYDVIVCDPPWPMEKIELDVLPTHVALDYPTMTLDEIGALTLPCAPDCHFWLWTTHKFLPDAFSLLKGWELKYVCCFVWYKGSGCGFQPIGLPKYNSEFALYARKGSPKFIDTKAFDTCFQEPREGHSVKPDGFYRMISRVTAGRRLDMFNRRKISGFDGWGKEAAK
jgi:N6-adenosine-specific RNA methylase IME4